MQEIGRGGRDGHAAQAILYFNNSDIKMQRKNRHAVSSTMRDYCLLDSCRRKFINIQFGEASNDNDVPSLHCCDVCENSIISHI